jgi:uncharacterized membrane protein
MAVGAVVAVGFNFRERVWFRCTALRRRQLTILVERKD